MTVFLLPFWFVFEESDVLSVLVGEALFPPPQADNTLAQRSRVKVEETFFKAKVVDI